MQSSVQLPATEFAKAVAVIGDLFPNLPSLAYQQFRKLDKDTQVGIIALLSLLGLAYAVHYFSTQR